MNNISGNFSNSVQIPVYTEPVNTENRSVNIKTEPYHAPEKLKLSRKIPDADTVKKSEKFLKKVGKVIKDIFDDIINAIKSWKPKSKKSFNPEEAIGNIEDITSIINDKPDTSTKK